MNLDDLLPKFQHRIDRVCVDPPPDASILEGMLDRARYDYSTYQPIERSFDFTLTDTEDRVAVLENGAPAEVVSTIGVFIHDGAPSFPLGQGHGSALDRAPESTWYAFEGTHAAYDAREMPSILFTHARYRRYYWREVTYYRANHDYRIIRPPTMTTVTGVILYGAVRPWEDIPAQDERLLLDRALVEFIDDTLVGETAGLIRIPTPHGSFEFDGGSVLLSLRNRLLEEFVGRLHTRLSHLSTG